jgi:hypothetical protein
MISRNQDGVVGAANESQEIILGGVNVTEDQVNLFPGRHIAGNVSVGDFAERLNDSDVVHTLSL